MTYDMSGTFREGDWNEEIYHTDNGLIVIGSTTQPYGVNNTCFRTVTVQDAPDALIDWMAYCYGAKVTHRGCFTEFQFSDGAVGIRNTVAIRQAFHATGYAYFDDCWQWLCPADIKERFGQDKEFRRP